jgi:hypothetical protein
MNPGRACARPPRSPEGRCTRAAEASFEEPSFRALCQAQEDPVVINTALVLDIGELKYERQR